MATRHVFLRFFGKLSSGYWRRAYCLTRTEPSMDGGCCIGNRSGGNDIWRDPANLPPAAAAVDSQAQRSDHLRPAATVSISCSSTGEELTSVLLLDLSH